MKKNGKYQSCKTKTLVSLPPVKWYWDLRIWSPLYVVLLLVVVFSLTHKAPVGAEEPIVTETITVETEPIVPEPTVPPEDTDIVALARLADSVAAGRPQEVKEIVMWIAINRSEDRANGYGGSLKEEIARPKQWQQYNPNAIYLESTYELAEKVYETWQTGGPRPIYNDMLWFVLNGDASITIRNQFKDGKNRSEMTFGQ